MVVSRRATQGPPYRGFPVEHCRAGSACPTAFNRGTSSNLRRGRCPHRPADRRKRSYILHRQRQRRKRRDDTTLRPLAKHSQTCGTHLNDLNRAGRAKGFLNRRFKRHSLGTFFRRRKKVPRRRHSSLAARRKGEKVLATWGVMKYNVIICVNSM